MMVRELLATMLRILKCGLTVSHALFWFACSSRDCSARSKRVGIYKTQVLPPDQFTKLGFCVNTRRVYPALRFNQNFPTILVFLCLKNTCVPTVCLQEQKANLFLPADLLLFPPSYLSIQSNVFVPKTIVIIANHL